MGKKSRRSSRGAETQASRRTADQSPGQARDEGRHGPKRRFALGALLAAAVLASYSGVLRNGFVNYDDETYILKNPQVLAGLTLRGIGWAFQATEAANWHPLTWISHMTDVELFGLEAAGHHAMSLLIHAINAILLFVLLRSATGADGRSAAVAGLFALHPLRVESVAWAAERKDVLSTLLALLAVWAYVRYARQGRRGSPYAWSLLFFALSLMAKPMPVTLPFLLLILDYWPLERLSLPGLLRRNPVSAVPIRRLILEKVPFLLLSVASSAVTYWAQRAGGATEATHLRLLARLDNAVVSYLRYIGKVLYPAKLAVLYPHSADAAGWRTAGAAMALLLLTGLIFIAARRFPYLLSGWLWYVGTLVPVIGVVQVGWQSMADRYTYFPAIGLAVMAVWGFWDLTARFRAARWVRPLAAFLVLAALAIATRAQVRRWSDSISLYQHTLASTQRNHIIHINLGHALQAQGRAAEALLQFQEALRARPDSHDAHYAVGTVLLSSGQASQAPEHFQEAIRLKPNRADAHHQLGAALALQGKWTESMPHLERALRLNPDLAEAHYVLGCALDALGRAEEAAERYRAAIRLKPDYAAAHKNLAEVLLRQGKDPQAPSFVPRPAQPSTHRGARN